jgi:hypothetical protein
MFPTPGRTSVFGEAGVLLGREIGSVPRTTDFAKRIWSRKPEEIQIRDSTGLRRDIYRACIRTYSVGAAMSANSISSSD